MSFQRRGVPPSQEMWRTLEEGCLPLERWCPPSLSHSHMAISWSFGDVAAHIPHTCLIFLLQVVCPPLLGSSPWSYLYKHSLPLQTSWSWGVLLVVVYYCNTFIWNKKTLEVKKVCYTCVWMLDVICA
jgi:hypothetical protein